MKLMERLKLFILKRRAERAMIKMDRAINKGNHSQACRYEDLMYQTDEELFNFISALSMKYVP